MIHTAIVTTAGVGSHYDVLVGLGLAGVCVLVGLVAGAVELVRRWHR